jgi:hypothetical protein
VISVIAPSRKTSLQAFPFLLWIWQIGPANRSLAAGPSSLRRNIACHHYDEDGNGGTHNYYYFMLGRVRSDTERRSRRHNEQWRSRISILSMRKKKPAVYATAIAAPE